MRPTAPSFVEVFCFLSECWFNRFHVCCPLRGRSCFNFIPSRLIPPHPIPSHPTPPCPIPPPPTPSHPIAGFGQSRAEADPLLPGPGLAPSEETFQRGAVRYGTVHRWGLGRTALRLLARRVMLLLRVKHLPVFSVAGKSCWCFVAFDIFRLPFVPRFWYRCCSC